MTHQSNRRNFIKGLGALALSAFDPTVIRANPPPAPACPSGPLTGPDLTRLRGWGANIYPWEFLPEQTPYVPIPQLFTPYQKQSVAQIQYQERLLNSYGSAFDVLEFSPDLRAYDFTHWSTTYFPYTSRPFFVLYEHIFNAGYFPSDGTGPIDMDDLVNRRNFLRDIDFYFKNVICPNRHRYVTLGGRPVIYMWSSGQMIGDFPSLIEEAVQLYNVAIIGSGEDIGDAKRLKAFDGLMEYGIPGFGGEQGDYALMVSSYHEYSIAVRTTLNKIQEETGKRILFIPTFQAAYDDTLVIPKRNNNPVYPKTRDEMVENARLLRLGMGVDAAMGLAPRWQIHDNVGPFVILSELPEGASVLPTLPWPERLGRYAGYGTGRIDIVKEFFGGGR